MLELRNSQVIRTDSIERRQASSEHLVDAAKFAGTLDRADVRSFLHSADHTRITTGIAADGTERLFREVEALRARPDLLGERHQGISKPPALLGRLLQEMICQAHRSFSANTGQT